MQPGKDGFLNMARIVSAARYHTMSDSFSIWRIRFCKFAICPLAALKGGAKYFRTNVVASVVEFTQEISYFWSLNTFVPLLTIGIH